VVEVPIIPNDDFGDVVFGGDDCEKNGNIPFLEASPIFLLCRYHIVTATGQLAFIPVFVTVTPVQPRPVLARPPFFFAAAPPPPPVQLAVAWPVEVLPTTVCTAKARTIKEKATRNIVPQ
jgi:hypothetical protein